MFSRSISRILLPALLPLFAIACGGSSADDTTVPPSTQPPGSTPADTHAAFHFFADRDGKPTEVGSIIYFERFTTRVEGLPPNADVTLVAHMYSPGTKGRGWTSSVVFTADAAGVVDTSKMAPKSGSYDGVDPDGPFWSMKEGPLDEGMWPNRKDAYFEAKLDDKVVGSASLKRTMMADKILVTPIDQGGLVAEYFQPDGVTDRIPVVAFGGSEGGIFGGESYAAHVASMGYPALAVAYFGTKGVPADLENVPLEYFEKAFTWLDARPETRHGKAIVIGGSRGGELALQLGATFPNVVGVIANTPSAYRWPGLGDPRKAAWTFGGTALPFVPNGSFFGNPETVTTPDGRDAYVTKPFFDASLKSAKPADLEAARIQVENTKGPILMIGGDDDKMWPACDFLKVALGKLQETGHAKTFGDEAVCVPGAGHDVGSVGLPTAPAAFADLGDTVYALGGTPKATAQAGRLAEDKIKAFLARVAK